jgi:integrase
MGKLTKIEVDNIKAEGRYGDGDNLWLQVQLGAQNTVRKSWLFRYRLPGQKAREMGFGAYPDVTLAEAREKARQGRRLLEQGIDPIAEREAMRIKAAAAAHTFREAAESFVADNHGKWSPKYAYVWQCRIKRHAYPQIGDLPVGDIDESAVLRVLKPLWYTIPVEGEAVRHGIMAVLNYARYHGWRSRTELNPAAWVGQLEFALPRISDIHTARHHPSLPWQQIGTFMQRLRMIEIADFAHGNSLHQITVPTLIFQILTAVRPGEAREAMWSEIDLGAKLWIIPKERMKMRNDHRVPLSDAAIEILLRMEKRRKTDVVFLGGSRKPLNATAIQRLVNKLDVKDPNGTRVVPHGFRSTFSTWAREATNYSRDLIEMAMAHEVKSDVEAAYFRGDHLEQRRPLMDDWAKVCNGEWQPAEVVPLRRKAQGE